MNHNISMLAEPLLQKFVQRVEQQFGTRIQAIFKLGSLGSHGDFSLCSDVDVALMLDQIQATDYHEIAALTDELKQSGLEYAERLSVFWSSYHPADFSKGLGRFPALDRLDILQHGILLRGEDKRAQLPAPNQADLVIESAKFISSYMLAEDKVEKLTLYPDKIASSGARNFTKAVLFPVRLVLTLDQPMTIGSNYDAVMHFNATWVKAVPEARELVNIAYQSRSKPAEQPILLESSQLQAILPLYVYCIERYHSAVMALAELSLAEHLHKEMMRLRAKP